MKPNCELAVVIVNYNTRDLLLECIASVLESTGSISTELVVVDNASSDRSFEAVRKAFPRVTVIANPTNRGFGGACNQAISKTTSFFILLLNSDSRLTPQGFKVPRKCMYQHSRCGAAGCRIINAKGEQLTSTWNFLTPFNQAFEMLTNRINSHLLLRSHRPNVEKDSLDCGVDWIDVSCLILRRAALEEVGLFDEQFFMYSEDEDLCLRLRKRGWLVCFSSAATVFYRGIASSAQNKSEMLVQFYLSQMRFLLKHRGLASVRTYAALMKLVLMAENGFNKLSSRTVGAVESEERLSAFRRAYSSLALQKQ
jgi:GT2 family glycosyltransferase